jgi:hypothetical protein
MKEGRAFLSGLSEPAEAAVRTEVGVLRLGRGRGSAAQSVCGDLGPTL